VDERAIDIVKAISLLVRKQRVPAQRTSQHIQASLEDIASRNLKTLGVPIKQNETG
jgi:hypothetical protein